MNASIAWIASGQINESRIRTPTAYITEKALQQCPLVLLPVGTVLVAMIGQGKTRGMAAILEVEATINQNLAYIRPCRRVDSEYLLAYLQHNYMHLRNSGRGSNQDALNCQILKQFPLPLPPNNSPGASQPPAINMH